MTGLPCSGKSTLAQSLYNKLENNNIKSFIIDGDILRKGLCNNLGFSYEERKENLRRAACLAQILSEIDLVVIVACITPYQEHREYIKEILGPLYNELYINTSINECIKRDVKGMYKLAIEGKIKNFTGISDRFDIPCNYDIYVNTEIETIEESTEKVYQFIIK